MRQPAVAPAGFKLRVSSRIDALAIVKAMLQVGTAPDFIIVDGSEGGTGAAPLEFEDHVGMPLTQGLMLMHNALVGVGLRDRVRVGASGKVASSADLAKRMIQGADYLNAARAMMVAVGCIQAQRCNTNHCPVGVATQSARRARALDGPSKADRVRSYQQETVREAMTMMAAMGVEHPRHLDPPMLRRNVSAHNNQSYAEIHEWLEPGQLIHEPLATWAADWAAASAVTARSAASGRRRRAGSVPEATGCRPA